MATTVMEAEGKRLMYWAHLDK